MNVQSSDIDKKKYLRWEQIMVEQIMKCLRNDSMHLHMSNSWVFILVVTTQQRFQYPT